jgi:hypothetical protein
MATVSFHEIQQRYYSYAPLKDITPYELALLLPLFAGASYGDGEWNTGGRLVPHKDRQQPGFPCDGRAVVLLADYHEQELGTAMRHFVKLPVER